MATARRKAGARLMTGVDELDKKLAELKIGAANKIARPALTKAARLLLKKIKAGVPPKYKDAKKALGMVVDTKGGRLKNEQRAKVGVAVGKASKAKRKGGRTRPGVGIGPENLHWFILGTARRETGSVQRKNKFGKYRKKTGNAVRSTGVMPRQPGLVGLVQDAVNSKRAEMQSVMIASATEGLAKIAAK